MTDTRKTLQGLLQRFNREHRVLGCALITRDGLPYACALPANINLDAFAAMAATMMGAAETAASEIDPKPSGAVLAQFQAVRIVVINAGSELLAVMVGDGTRAMEELLAWARRLVDELRHHL